MDWPRNATKMTERLRVMLAVGVTTLLAGQAMTGNALAEAFTPQPDDSSVLASGQCPSGATLPSYVEYDLGTSFGGYQLAAKFQACTQAPPDVARLWEVEPVNSLPVEKPTPTEPLVPNTSATYGECDAFVGACTQPLVVQSWPQCDRNPSAYAAVYPYVNALNLGTTPEGLESEIEAKSGVSTNPDAPVTIASNPTMPAASFEEGHRLEMYTGQTTIVIFAESTSLAMEAANALGRLVPQPATGYWGNLEASPWQCSPTVAGK